MYSSLLLLLPITTTMTDSKHQLLAVVSLPLLILFRQLVLLKLLQVRLHSHWQKYQWELFLRVKHV